MKTTDRKIVEIILDLDVVEKGRVIMRVYGDSL